ncbi:hypothetical protein D3C77_804650 [compost metagenome]
MVAEPSRGMSWRRSRSWVGAITGWMLMVVLKLRNGTGPLVLLSSSVKASKVVLAMLFFRLLALLQ